MPTRFDPYGARFRYCERIHSFDFVRSILSAIIASFHFHHSVFGCGLMSRTACMVMVDAPEIRRP